MAKVQVYKRGGFFRWLLSLYTFGSAGSLSYDHLEISYKTAFMNMGGKFSYPITDLETIEIVRFIDFLIIPRKCLKLTFKDGESHKITFHLRKEKDAFLEALSYKLEEPGKKGEMGNE